MVRLRVALGLGLGLVAAMAVVSTAGAQESPGEVGSAVTSFGPGDWLGLIVRLALVVGVIWAAVYGMRWYVRRMGGGGNRGGLGALEVLETHALGPNRALHLVRLGDRAVLVGATQERITQLLTVDDPDELKRLTERPEAEPRDVRGRPALSMRSSLSMGLASFRTGLAAMREQHQQVRARRQAARAMRAIEDTRQGAAVPTSTSTRAGATAAQAPAGNSATQEPASRFPAVRGLFRRTRRAQPAPAVERESRQSLFDRTLASIDAIEIAQQAPSAAGLQARAGYGRTASGREASGEGDPSAGARRAPVGPSGRTREAQIADLQRAIAAARKQAG